jgi:predicted dehydrogenase
MNKVTKLGVIGVGRMGQGHCRNYSNLRTAELVGVCDTNAELGNRAAQRYEVPYYQDVDELLDKVDAVSLVTPTPSHYDLAVKCLEHGVHVLVEKPFTETEEQAVALVKKAEESGLVVQVGHIERFNPAYLELKNVLENFTILAVNFRRLSPYAGSNTDVDVVLDLMIHDTDLVIDLAGREPKTVWAAGINAYDKAVDHASAQLCFEPGLLMSLVASRLTEEKVRSIEVTALEAYVQANLLNKTVTIHRRTTGQYLNHNLSDVKYRQEGIVESILVPVVEPLAAELQHFVDCIQKGKQPLVSAKSGLEALRLALCIREMCRTNMVTLSDKIKAGVK